MIIAEQKKQTNIAEYILYMWQIEDMLRGSDFNIETIEQAIISKFETDEPTKTRIKEWYVSLIDKMKSENIVEKGHLIEINLEIEKMQHILNQMVNDQDADFNSFWGEVKSYINEFRTKFISQDISDVEVCLNALYAVLILKLKGVDITIETKEAADTFSKLLVQIVKKHHA